MGLTSNKIVDFSKLSETRSNSVTSEVENVKKAEDRGNLYQKATNKISLISQLPHVADEKNVTLDPEPLCLFFLMSIVSN